MTEQEAVKLLREHGPLITVEFARAAWPDSEGWHRLRKCGNRNTSSRGAGMSWAAAGLLGRLQKKGLVESLYKEGQILWRATKTCTP